MYPVRFAAPGMDGTYPPPLSGEAGRPGGSGLAGVVPAAEALPVGRIEMRATVAPFDDMVGKEPVFRRRPIATPPVIDSLAAISRTLEDFRPPLTMRLRQQFGVCTLRRDLQHAPVCYTEPDASRPEFGHRRVNLERRSDRDEGGHIEPVIRDPRDCGTVGLNRYGVDHAGNSRHAIAKRHANHGRLLCLDLVESSPLRTG